MSKIRDISAREILDSRGIPTVEVEIALANGIKTSASVPGGTSCGRFEACEIRDKDGRGVKKAVSNIINKIAPRLHGANVDNPKDIDEILCLIDGTESKSKIGANAILGVSLAAWKANSLVDRTELFRRISKIYGFKREALPKPEAVMIEGGLHSSSNLDFQEFMITSTRKKISDCVSDISLVYETLKKYLKKNGYGTNVGLEGAFGPNFSSNREAIDFIARAISDSGLTLGKNIFICLDIAAGSFWDEKTKKYLLKLENAALTPSQMVGYIENLLKKFPIMSIEDPLAEEDFEGWQYLTERVGDKVAIVGDDLFVTNPARIQHGIEYQLANAVIIKPNQIGTVSEAAESILLAKKAGWKTIVSHRSGETNDDFIVDLAVGAGADFLKIGAPSRGERVAKYNRLLAIERVEK